jgi:hypothetical protein
LFSRNSFDDSTLGDDAAFAGPDHAGQFRTQAQKPCDPALNVRQLSACNAACFLAGRIRLLLQSKKTSNTREIKAQFTGVTNEAKPSSISVGVAASPILLSRRDGQNANTLIISNGFDIDACGVR